MATATNGETRTTAPLGLRVKKTTLPELDRLALLVGNNRSRVALALMRRGLDDLLALPEKRQRDTLIEYLNRLQE